MNIFLHQFLIIMPVSVIFRRFLPLLFILAIFTLYLFSMAPDLTWAHTGADGGDLISAAATGGVAHPSGYPTFLILARFFQFLPIGSIAYRTNLLSAVFTALTAWLVYDIVVAAPKSPAKGMHIAGLITACAYGLSPLAWSQAVITEVYGLHLFFVALVLWLLLGRFADSPHKTRLDLALGLAIGLGMGNHLTLVFLLPAVLLVGTIASIPFNVKRKGPGIAVDWASIIRRLGALCIGLLVYLSIPWRAASAAPVNWGNAVNFHNLWWLASGALYQDRVLSLPLADVLSRLAASANMLVTQFGAIGLLLGFYHLFGNASSSRILWVNTWLAVVSIIFSLSYATSDSYVYLLPFFLVFSIWIGFAVGNIITLLTNRKNWMTFGANSLFLAFFCGMAFVHYPDVNLSDDHAPEAYTQKVFKALPPQAIVLAEGDQAIFSLWYYHFVQKERPDIAVLANGLMPYDWYFDVLQDTYPTLNLSVKETLSIRNTMTQANPDRPVCDVARDEEKMSIICYPPASQKNKTPFISIIEPVEKSK